ncbi:MAG: hypothetical protein J5586_08875 [Clostridia bacterium]|nr:hypothetical protein [Clostridia bacterium]
MKRFAGYTAAMLALALVLTAAGCKKPDGKDASASTPVPIVTASPDGEVTQGPTATPEPVFSDVPVVTRSPDGDVTEGPTATPTAAPTEIPAETGSQGGEATHAPTNTPTAAPTSAAETPKPATPTPGSADPTGTPAATHQAPVPTPETPNDHAAVYAGAVVDCSSMHVGDSFYWTLDLVNEGSCLFAGTWLIEHPVAFLTPAAISSTWSGGLLSAINATYEDEAPYSDTAQIAVNLLYEGGTGSDPMGEAGHSYAVAALYITSFDYCGVQMAGSLVRIRYEIAAIPGEADMLHDGNGWYLPVPITVVTSAAMEPPLNAVTHGSITVTDGKLYFKH